MSPDATDCVPAVVVGGGINGLGVLRSLAPAGVPITVLGTDAREPAMRSRYGRKALYREDGPDAVVEALEKLADQMLGKRPFLILTQEGVVASVSTHRERLQALYQIALPEADVLTSLMHKDGFRSIAEAAGAAVPRTLHITNPGQVETVRTLRPPLVVKPSIRDAAYFNTFRKAYRVDTIDEARELVHRILPIFPDIVVQEWIEGSDSDIYFCLQYITASGDMAASFVGRKIRSWPPRVGGTASCGPASGEETTTLTKRTSEFFRHAGICGFASMEYKRDVRSGEFFMVEPTVGRTDYQEEVATLNGVNIPLAAYQAELGLGQTSTRMPHPVRIWRDRDADRQSAIDANGTDPWKPDRAHVVDALWRASDPMPAVSQYANRVVRRTRRLFAGS